MRTLLAIVALLPGCYWASIKKESSIGYYVCKWPDFPNYKSAYGPLTCEPYEDWRGFQEPVPEKDTFIINASR
jgi:hypothetical protein